MILLFYKNYTYIKNELIFRQVEDRRVKLGLVPLNFSQFEVYCNHYSERKYREEICSNLQSSSMVSVKFPTRN